jgi:PEP-CTERM/exosortase A-associated glycosyltransferase
LLGRDKELSTVGDIVSREPKAQLVGEERLGQLRILHVLDHSVPIHSGYSFRSLALFREQRRRGWHTAQLTTPKHTATGPSPEEVDGFTFHRTRALSGAVTELPIVRELALVRAVARRIEDVAQTERAQVLHAHSPVLNALACLSAARRLHLPVVYEVRGFWEDAAVSHGTAREGGLRYRATRALETYALQRCDAVAAICEGVRQDMLERGISSNRITLIPNGVDIEEFSTGIEADAALRASLGLNGKIVLGFLGSFYAYEGLDLLLSALPAIHHDQPNVVVLLVGGGPAEAALKEQVRHLGLAEAARFVSRVPHHLIQGYYDLVDIFVYPRHRMRLTERVTPLKPLEAMARGGIVLASDVGGHRELMNDGETGLLFRADDSDDLARSVLSLMAHKDHWPAMRTRARRFVERERTWTLSAAGYEELYTRALHAHRD